MAANVFDQFDEAPSAVEPPEPMPKMRGHGRVSALQPNRPALWNDDGTYSTERTITVERDGKHYLIPTVVGGQQLSETDAIAEAMKPDGEIFGVFENKDDADAYSVWRSRETDRQRRAAGYRTRGKPGEAPPNVFDQFDATAHLERPRNRAQRRAFIYPFPEVVDPEDPNLGTYGQFRRNLAKGVGGLLNAWDGYKLFSEASDMRAISDLLERPDPNFPVSEETLRSLLTTKADRFFKTLGDIERRKQRVAQFGSREATERFMSAEGFKASLKAVAEDPTGVIGDLGAQSLPYMLSGALIVWLAGGAGAPAAVSAAAGGIGGSGLQEFATRYADLRTDGVDHDTAWHKAAVQSGAIALFDAVSFRSAGKVFDSFLMKGGGGFARRAGAKTVKAGAETLRQAALGAGGEAYSQLLGGDVGKPGSTANIMGEALGEVFPWPVEAVLAGPSETAQRMQGEREAKAAELTRLRTLHDMESGHVQSLLAGLEESDAAGVLVDPRRRRMLDELRRYAADPAAAHQRMADLEKELEPQVGKPGLLQQMRDRLRSKPGAIAGGEAVGPAPPTAPPAPPEGAAAPPQAPPTAGPEQAPEAPAAPPGAEPARPTAAPAPVIKLQYPGSEDEPGKQAEVYPLDEDTFNRYVRAQVPKKLNTLEAYRKEYPERTHVRVHRKAGKEFTYDRSGNLDDLRERGALDVTEPGFESEAAQRHARRPAPQEPGKRDPNPRRDTLIQYISKRGGLSPDIELADFFKGAGYDAVTPLIRKGGMTLDHAAEILHEAGYDVVNDEGNYDPYVLERALRQDFRAGPQGGNVYSRDSDVPQELETRRAQEEAAKRAAEEDAAIKAAEEAAKAETPAAEPETKAAEPETKEPTGETAEPPGETQAEPEPAAEPAKPEPEAQPEPEAKAAADVEAAAAETDTEPTDGQIEAGNYKKGHVNLHGLDISIENPRGSERHGVNKNGTAWTRVLTHHYGYIRGTVGRDKDHVDVFIGPDPASERAFVIDQVDPQTGKFDEHKIMLGFENAGHARDGYMGNYPIGWKGFGAIHEVSLDELKTWLKGGDTKRPFARPAAEAKPEPEPQPEPEQAEEPAPPPEATPEDTAQQKLADLVKSLRSRIGKEYAATRAFGSELKPAVDARDWKKIREIAGRHYAQFPDIVQAIDQILSGPNDELMLGYEHAAPEPAPEPEAKEPPKDIDKLSDDDIDALLADEEPAAVPAAEPKVPAAEAEPEKPAAPAEIDMEGFRERLAVIDDAGLDQMISDFKGREGDSIVGPMLEAALHERQLRDAPLDVLRELEAHLLTSPDILAAYSQDDAGFHEAVIEAAQAWLKSQADETDAVRKFGIGEITDQPESYINEAFSAELKKRVEPPKKARREKPEGIGEQLRRHWELMDKKKDREAKDVDELIAEFKELTDRAEVFDVTLRDDATPGLERMKREVQLRVTPFSRYFVSFVGRYDIKNMSDVVEYYLGDLAEARRRLDEASQRWLKAVRPLVEAIANSANITEFEKKLDRDFKRTIGPVIDTWGLDRVIAKHKKRENEAAIEDQNKRLPLNRPRLDTVVREGLPDARGGKDIKAEDFQKHFGFAGITIGNYVTAEQAQKHLNYAFDAFTSLAHKLGIEPRAISFGGELHFAIGALGMGKFAAHYQDQHPRATGGTVHVINVTNTKGDGTVAHEWMHALDYALRRNTRIEQKPEGGTRTTLGHHAMRVVVHQLKITDLGSEEAQEKLKRRALMFMDGSTYWPHLGKNKQPPIEHAHYMLNQAIAYVEGGRAMGDEMSRRELRSTFFKNARNLDGAQERTRRRSKDDEGAYWSNQYEPFARAGEAWVYDMLKASGQRDDYLVTDFVEEGKTTDAVYRGTPYPMAPEREHFANLFKALLADITWEDGKPVVKTADNLHAFVQQQTNLIEAMRKNLPALVEERDAKKREKEAAARKQKEAEEAERQKKLREDIERLKRPGAKIEPDDEQATPATPPVDSIALPPDDIEEEIGALSDDDIDAMINAADAEVQEAKQEERPEPPPPPPVLKPHDATWSAVHKIQDIITTRVMKAEELFAIMDEAVGKKREDGGYEAKDAYDVAEFALHTLIAALPNTGIAEIRTWYTNLPRQRIRNTEQMAYQQYSTPPELAEAMAYAANIRPDELVLEPSAGTGALAVWALRAGARLALNEMNGRRAQLLGRLPGSGVVGRNDATHINNVLASAGVKPTVVLMNPPFSANAKTGAKGNQVGQAHVKSALAALRRAGGGRAVILLGEGMSPSTTGGDKFWKELERGDVLPSGYRVRALIDVEGREYAKYGTTFGSVLAVVDVHTPANMPGLVPRVTGKANTFAELKPLLEGVRNDRPDKPALGEPTQPGVPDRTGGAPGPESAVQHPVSPPGAGRGPDTAAPGEAGAATGAGASDLGAVAGEPDVGARTGQPPTTVEGGGVEQRNAIRAATGRRNGPAANRAFASLPAGTELKAIPAHMRMEAQAMAAGARPAPEQGPPQIPPPPEPPPPPPPPPPRPPLKDLAESFAKHGVTGVSETLQGLAELFGGSSAKSFPAGLDPETYARAKPHFDNALIAFKAAGKDAKEMVAALIAQFGQAIKPYLAHYLKERNRQNRDETPQSANELRDAERDVVFVNYKSKLGARIEGSKPHPGELVETAALSSVAYPDTDYVPKIDRKILESGGISQEQLDAVILAGASHEQMLPADAGKPEYRRGILVGDGTGTGKTRIIYGILHDNWNRGRKRAVWVTKASGLFGQITEDAVKTGFPTNRIVEHSDAATTAEKIKLKEGVLLTSYSTLRQPLQIREDTKVTIEDGQKQTALRTDQIVEWLGPDFDGVIVFDEAHLMRNTAEDADLDDTATSRASAGKRGGKKKGGDLFKSKTVSKQAIAATDLAKRLPKARVVYTTATSAVEVEHLAYMARLGLWGAETSFGNLAEFVAEIAEGGLMAMEAVTTNMKAMGVLIARSVTYRGVTHQTLTHKITPEQREMYDKIAEAWQIVLQNVEAAFEETGIKKDGRAKAKTNNKLWSFQQRFFQKLLTAMQMPSVIASMKEELAKGNAPVMQIVNTNQASVDRALAKAKEDDTALDDIDLSPREDLLKTVANAFPVQQYEEEIRTTPGGKIVKVMVPVFEDYIDEDGKPAQRPMLNAEAVARREALLRELRMVKMPQGALEELFSAFGSSDNIAEITGRKTRIFRNARGESVQEDLPPSRAHKDMQDFKDGKKMVAIFSDRGGTGFNFHSDREYKNQARRIHYLVQAGWEAIQAMQGFGRTNRSNQANAPHFILVTTDLPAQMRFISSIARRLDQLGAMAGGERKSASQGVFTSEMNLENKYGVEAVRRFMKDADQGLIGTQGQQEIRSTAEAVPEPNDRITTADIKRELGIELRPPDKDGNPGEFQENKIPKVPQFLNRMLSLRVDRMNLYFGEFIARLQEEIETAKESGTYDAGIATIEGKAIHVVDRTRLFERGALAADLVKLAVTRDLKYNSWDYAAGEFGQINNAALMFFARNVKSHRVYAFYEAKPFTDAKGITHNRYRRVSIGGWTMTNFEEVTVDMKDGMRLVNGQRMHAFSGQGNYAELDPAEAMDAWDTELAEAPPEETVDRYLVTGALLPIWKRIKESLEIFKVITDDRERLLGRQVKEPRVLLKDFGIEVQVEVTSKQAIDRIRQRGFRYRLANGWIVTSRMVHGTRLIEIEGPGWSDRHYLGNVGARDEFIDNKQRYFLLSDQAVEQLDKIRETSPIIDEYPPGKDQRFNIRRQPGKPKGVALDVAQAHAQKLRRTVPVGITVVKDEAQLPDSARSKATAHGVTGRIEGVYDPVTDSIYVVADNLDTVEDVGRVIFAEGYGHFGARRMFGKEVNPFLRKVAMVYGRTGLREIANLYGLDLATDEGLLEAAEEKLSEIAEDVSAGKASSVARNLLAQVVGFVRDWLRRHGWSDRDLTRLEIRRVMIEARRRVRENIVEPLPPDSNFLQMAADEQMRRGNWFARQVQLGQPVDRALRAAFSVVLPAFTIDPHGRATLRPWARRMLGASQTIGRNAFTRAFTWMKPLTDRAVAAIGAERVEGFTDALHAGYETARAGLTSGYGLPEAYVERYLQLKREQRGILQAGMDFFKQMVDRGVDVEEAKVLNAILQGREFDAAETQALQALASPIIQAIDAMQDQAVLYGLISPATREKNRSKYMHISYMKWEDSKSPLIKKIETLGRRRRVRLVSDQMRERGLTLYPTQAQVENGVPQDWWARKVEKGKADKALVGQRFHVLRWNGPNPAPAMGDVVANAYAEAAAEAAREKGATGGEQLAAGVTAHVENRGGPRSRRPLKTIYWPAELPIPGRLEAWDDTGVYEVQEVKGGQVRLHRDYTSEERAQMGEILDARYNVLKTFALFSENIANGHFYHDIAQNSEWATTTEPGKEGVDWVHGKVTMLRPTHATINWVKVPRTTLTGTATPRFGALAGMWVRAEIWRDLNEMEVAMRETFWRAMMQQFKLNHTARSPVVHVNNVMSNLVFMDLADIRLRDLARGLEAWVNRDDNYEQARVDGVFGHGYIAQEFHRDALKPMLAELRTAELEGLGGKIGWLRKVSQAIFKADEKMRNAYQTEDEVFRMAMYLRELARGEDRQTAAKRAREQFIDYDIRAPWINFLRDTILPFISYRYRAIPVVAKAIAERPWKLAKLALYGYIANAAAYMLDPDGDEEKERRSMPEQLRGQTWLGIPGLYTVPRMIRLGRDSHGNPVFLDIRRWVPVGDVFDLGADQWSLPFVPSLFDAGGPIEIAAELAFNRSAFTGQDIVDKEIDPWTTKTQKTISHVWRSWVPSAPWIPFSWYFDKIGRAWTGGRDPLMRPYLLWQAIASSLGVKVSPQDIAENFEYRRREFDHIDRALKEELRLLQRDRMRGLISESTYADEAKAIEGRMAELQERMMETFLSEEQRTQRGEKR